MRRLHHLAAAAAAIVVIVPLYIPEALAFPFHRQVGTATIWSDRPIPPAIGRVMARADALIAASPIATVPSGRRIFLTDGGWRWRWLAPTANGAFALTRPLSEAVIVNRSDVADDRVFNGATIGGVRTLSGVLAHERTHTLMRARYGQVAVATLPLWLREGYHDHIARESSLSARQAEVLRGAVDHPPALAYFDARRRVERDLATGATIDALVASAHR